MRLPVTKLLAALALLLLLPPAAVAAEEPEGVYAKYHRAAIGGNLDEMLAHSLALHRADMKGMSAANRNAALKMAQSMMPRVFTVERKMPGPNGRAMLIVSGPWSGPDGMVPVYGTAQLRMEDDAWKIIGVSWTTERPAIVSAPKPAAAPTAAEKSAANAPPMSTKGAPVVGSMAAEATGKKLGAAKPECVYKPVMTAQDMGNCKWKRGSPTARGGRSVERQRFLYVGRRTGTAIGRSSLWRKLMRPRVRS